MSDPKGTQAVILAGGKGRRLAPYTAVLPKPLMPVGDYPIAEVLVRQLKRSGCTEIIFAVGHLAELLEAYFGDGSRYGVKIRYCRELEPLGTAAPLRNIQGLSETFYVLNGDTLTNLDFEKLLEFHTMQRSLLTIAGLNRKVPIDFGVLEIDGNRLVGYNEKPIHQYWVSIGVYVFNRSVLKYIPGSGPLDFPDLIKILLKENQAVSVFPFEDFWLDIGRIEDYQRSIEEFEKRKGDLLGEV
jgi:NDP-sugar pyrophosphorylase family protein